MKIPESPLLGDFIGDLNSNWGGYSRVLQRRRRLRQLVAMMRGVADAAELSGTVRGRSLNRWLDLLRDEALGAQAVLDVSGYPPADAGSAKKFLAMVKALFVWSAEDDRLNDAVDALERLTGPGGDLDIFLKVLASSMPPWTWTALTPIFCYRPGREDEARLELSRGLGG